MLDAERLDLDELYHGPDWAPTPTPEFRRRVAAALAAADASGWVIAGNYAMVSDLTQGGADTIVWLDLPRWLSVSRVVRRSIRRVVHREALWNGNRESLGNLFRRDPDRNVALAAWRNHPLYELQYGEFAAGPFWAHADVHRLRSRREIDDFVRSVATA